MGLPVPSLQHLAALHFGTYFMLWLRCSLSPWFRYVLLLLVRSLLSPRPVSRVAWLLRVVSHAAGATCTVSDVHNARPLFATQSHCASSPAQWTTTPEALCAAADLLWLCTEQAEWRRRFVEFLRSHAVTTILALQIMGGVMLCLYFAIAAETCLGPTRCFWMRRCCGRKYYAHADSHATSIAPAPSKEDTTAATLDEIMLRHQQEFQEVAFPTGEIDEDNSTTGNAASTENASTENELAPMRAQATTVATPW